MKADKLMKRVWGNKGLTKEQIKQYITNGGSRCPYCGNNDLENGLKEEDSGVMWKKIFCRKCKRKWQEVFTLTTINILDERLNTSSDMPDSFINIFKELLGSAQEALEYINNNDERYIHEDVETDDKHQCSRDFCTLCNLRESVHKAEILVEELESIPSITDSIIDNQKKEKVFCLISGRNLQAVWSTFSNNIDIVLIDEDNGECDEKTAIENIELLKEIEAGVEAGCVWTIF